MARTTQEDENTSAPRKTSSKAIIKSIPTKPAKSSMTAANKTALLLQAKIDKGLMKPMHQAIATDMHKKIFPFMKLPLELRTEVYRYCLVQEGKTCTARLNSSTGTVWEKGGKILRVNKEIYTEAAPIFYGENNLEVWTPDFGVYHTISKRNAKLVKELTMPSGRPFLRENMAALKNFTQLKTLNLLHSKRVVIDIDSIPLPSAPVAGSYVGHFSGVFMRSSTALPQLPEEILERARQGKLTLNLFLEVSEYNPPGALLLKRIGSVRAAYRKHHPTWRAGRVDRYCLVAAPKTLMPGGAEMVWKGRLGVPYELVFSGESRAMSNEHDHL